MSCPRQPDAAARSPQRAGLSAAVALLLVLAQALLLQHQVEHVDGGAGVECSVCISGTALAHAAMASAGTHQLYAAFCRPAPARSEAPHATATRQANARAPPSSGTV